MWLSTADFNAENRESGPPSTEAGVSAQARFPGFEHVPDASDNLSPMEHPFSKQNSLNRTSRWQVALQSRSVAILLIASVLILATGVHLRMYGLGAPSLWADEFSTWWVSTIPIAESFRWGPELTQAPLYQLLVRTLTTSAHPSEWTLRFPAALAGSFAVIAAYVLGRKTGGRAVGVAFAALMAVNPLQIQYSQEARSYSMLMLGAVVSMACWHSLVKHPTGPRFLCYTVTTVFAFHAHYMMAAVIVAEILWWPIPNWRSRRGEAALAEGRFSNAHDEAGPRFPLTFGLSFPLPQEKVPYHDTDETTTVKARRFLPGFAILCVLGACAPIALHVLHSRATALRSVNWIPQPTWNAAFGLLNQLTFGPVWVWGVLAPAMMLWTLAAARRILSRHVRAGRIIADRSDPVVLLLVWLICSWGGLVAVSWLVHPALLARYALSAAAPAMLLPLIVASRLDARIPVVIALLFGGLALWDWTHAVGDTGPGFRELAAYLQEHVNAEREAVVLVLDQPTPELQELDRLPFRYYPLVKIPILELPLQADGVTPAGDALKDSRPLWMVVFRADALAIARSAGREPDVIKIGEDEYTQLPFLPYRLAQVKGMLVDANRKSSSCPAGKATHFRTRSQ